MPDEQVQLVQKFDEAPIQVVEYTYSWEPDRFVFDFKNVTSQFGPAGNPRQLMMTHKVVTMDPDLAKQFAEQLVDAIGKYEEKFGPIVKSKAKQKAEEEMSAAQAETSSRGEKPSYYG